MIHFANRKSAPRKGIHFNVTPLLDVVLLLVIFFMLVYDYTNRQSFPLTPPGDCSQVRSADTSHLDALTVSIFPAVSPGQPSDFTADIAASGDFTPPAELPTSPAKQSAIKITETLPVLYAVRDLKFDPSRPDYQNNPELLINAMCDQIKLQLNQNPTQMVHLRAHRDLSYGQVQTSLIALARAGVQKIQLAAQKSPSP